MKIALIGCGKMGEAMLAGWLASSSGVAASVHASDFIVVENTEQHCERLRADYNVDACCDISGIEGADIVVLAVKPQVLLDVLQNLGKQLAHASAPTLPLVISIAAGVPTTTIEDALPAGTHVVRTMPNTPLQVGEGATAVAAGVHASDADIQLVCDLFDSLGMAVVVDEGHIDAVCALSGAAPAYFARMIEGFVKAGVQAGLCAQTAEALLVQSGFGTFDLMRKTSQTPAQVRTAVCSPGGTTLASLAAQEAAGLDEVLAAGVQAAIARAKELAQ